MHREILSLFPEVTVLSSVIGKRYMIPGQAGLKKA
jgi:hypothetical protein